MRSHNYENEFIHSPARKDKTDEIDYDMDDDSCQTEEEEECQDGSLLIELPSQNKILNESMQSPLALKKKPRPHS